jgi:hypothetical protein
LLSAAAPALLAVRILAVLVLASVVLRCAGTIVEEPRAALGTPEQIKAALTGDDFRLKNQAREQLGSLPPADQMSLLAELIAEGDAPTRMLAVAELARLPGEASARILADVAASDPDPEVREFASLALQP